MKSLKSSLFAFVVGVVFFSSMAANATTFNLSPSSFNGGKLITKGFTDNIVFNVSTTSDLVANMTGQGIFFNLLGFDLYQGTVAGSSTKIATGDVTNTSFHHIFTSSSGSLSVAGLLGDYFLKIQYGLGVLGSYNGHVELNSPVITSPVPEASTSAMLFAGLALMGFVASRRKA